MFKDMDQSKKEKLIYLALGGMIALAGVIVGCKFGDSYATVRMDNGLNKLFNDDPTLKEHMGNAISKYLQK